MREESPDSPSVGLPELGPEAVALYLQALSDGELRRDGASSYDDMDEVAFRQARKALVASHLVVSDPFVDGRLIPNSPEAAAARLIKPMDDVIRSYQQQIAATREQLDLLMPAYLARRDAAVSRAGGAIETVAAAEDVRILIAEALQNCTTDLMTVQPGGARPANIDEVIARDADAVRRGVRMRVLYQHTARASLHTAAYVAAISDVGGQVRTVDQLAELMMIFDRATVFIPKWVHPDLPPGAVVVREPVLVGFLCSFFEQMWSTAAPFVPSTPGYQEVSDELRRSVLRLLAQGFKDEVVARKLGMSVRTCRRHIAAIMQDLGAESRFEAGVKAASMGLLETDVR